MAVEIGSLVVRGTFGQAQRDDAATREAVRADMQRLRRELLRDMREMLEQAERRTREG